MILGALFGLTCIAVATLIFSRRTRDPVALPVSLWLVLFGSTFTPMSAALPAEFPMLARLNELLSTAAFIAFFLLFFLFPDGRFVPRWTRWPALLLVLVIGLDSGSALNPENWGFVGIAVQVLLPVSVFYAQVHRYRHVSGPLQRKQTK